MNVNRKNARPDPDQANAPASLSSGPKCGCSASHAVAFHRRDFLKSLTASAGVLALQPWQAMAGPFTREDFEALVPADKKLQPAWLASLTERGERTVYTGADLDKIGMPVGGICAGQLYLGGDGKLWHWDIFNAHLRTGDQHYAKPLEATSPLEQGFALRVRAGAETSEWPLERHRWAKVSFNGEYPIATIEYRDPSCPVAITLEAFSPFIPLNVPDSSLPATILSFTVTNPGKVPVEADLAGWIENAVCLNSAKTRDGLRQNRLLRSEAMLALECSAEEVPGASAAKRPDILFETFEKETYAGWIATGTAFGKGPVDLAQMPAYQGQVGARGKRTVNSHATAPGTDVGAKDAATGTLTSPRFTVERNYITFLVGGGNHKEKTCVNLLVEGDAVLSATGGNDNRMQPVTWDVRRWVGKSASIQIVDNESGAWGNIGVDQIVFTDQPEKPSGPLATEPDFGTLTLALLNPQKGDFGRTSLPPGDILKSLFADGGSSKDPVQRRFGEKLAGSITRPFKLAPGTSQKAVFVVAWHMPNLKIDRLPPRRFYATRFDSASAVVRYIAGDLERLTNETRLWHDTWYDSSLPYWFLDRTFLNTSILATSTCYRFGNGRFYGWEGVGCCEGTCGHVWQYAHAVARLFPELERETREKVDFALALQPDGAIHFRGEFNNIPAIDAQAGTILRALREHQASADDAFLKRNWLAIRKATAWLLAKDGDGDGLIQGNQHNTLDTDWFGPVAWLSGLYLAALLAAETMAREVGDTEFAATCKRILETGRQNLVSQLFDGEYFINKPDTKHLDAINSGSGCHIDQVMGQSWAFQVGLPRVLPAKETASALRSLWRYNFTPDVGPYRAAYRPGRWYAMPGEAGLLMCTFPRKGWDYPEAKGKGADWAAGYFNECMNGFEYQVASHMIWEGLLTEGLAVTRAIHDRYHPSRRNPWNEVECGDHYARSMASYGVFLAACGFQYHGPDGRLAFAPRLSPSNFKCAFTTADGWGGYEQRFGDADGECKLHLKWGALRLRSFQLTPDPKLTVDGVRLNDQSITFRQPSPGQLAFPSALTLKAGDILHFQLTAA